MIISPSRETAAVRQNPAYTTFSGVFKDLRCFGTTPAFRPQIPHILDGARRLEPSTMPLVLFDGVCNFCNGTVLFIANRDPGKKFRFAALQSPVGQEILRKSGLSTDELETLVLVEGDRVVTRSTAALRISRSLSGAWPLVYALMVVPRPIRDFFYRLLARHRYRLFGRRDACMVPTPDLKERFLD